MILRYIRHINSSCELLQCAGRAMSINFICKYIASTIYMLSVCICVCVCDNYKLLITRVCACSGMPGGKFLLSYRRGLPTEYISSGSTDRRPISKSHVDLLSTGTRSASKYDDYPSDHIHCPWKSRARSLITSKPH